MGTTAKAGSAATSPAPRRPLTALDLVRLRDIGPVSQIGEVRLFSISPNGRFLAFQVREAVPDANSYKLSMWVLLPLAMSGPPQSVDQGGDLIRLSLDLFGKAATPTGIARPIVPAWSPDGDWFAFLKRVDGVDQVWRAWVDGRPAQRLFAAPIDIEDVAVTRDGRQLVIRTDPARARARGDIADEARRGFRMDGRFLPIASATPFPRPATHAQTEVIGITDSSVRVATTAEAALLAPPPPTAHARSSAGAFTLTRQATADHLLDEQLVLVPSHGTQRGCDAPWCQGRLAGPWATPDGMDFLFLRREGWADSRTALYRWRPGQRTPRRVLVTDDLLDSCEPWRAGLICLTQGSIVPRRFLYIDARRARSRVLFDPNPQLAGLTLGQVTREYWVNAFGIPVFGDVVLPTNCRKDHRYPLIVVQYESRGFLRGGTGDEFPIQLFANHGYVVLSQQNPRPSGMQVARDFVDVDRLGLEHFADRRSALSSIEIEVRRLIDRGLVDPRRVGITGLSDGSATVQYAAINSGLFAAGIVSGCCWSPEQDALVGAGVAAVYHQIGWPRLTDRDEAFWRSMSLAQSGSRFPLLFQAADDEYLLAMTSFTGLRQRGVPVEMFIYPHEHHVKYQPAHRLAVYERNLAWFDYWLKDAAPAEPDWIEQQASWDTYKRGRVDKR